jgi:nuclease S1
VFVSLFCLRVSAWGASGHEVIAYIAEQEISSTTRECVKSILSSHGYESMSDIASWADSYDHSTEGRWSAPQHYINVPDDAGRVDLHRDCTPFCVTTAIQNYTDILVSQHSDEEEKWFAFRLLVHYYADTHLPMHVGYGSDRGGTTVKVKLNGKTSTLHSVWDSGMIETQYPKSEWKNLASDVMSVLDNNERIAYASIDDPLDMANQVFLLTQTYAYDIPADRVLDDCYVIRGLDLEKKLLAMAGVRLAAALDKNMKC